MSELAERGTATELVARLTAWTRSKTKDEIFHEAQQWRIPMGKVSTIDEVTGLEQLVDRRFFEEVDHPVAGRRTYPGIPALFTETGRPPSGARRYWASTRRKSSAKSVTPTKTFWP